jgi:hypothetical protein
LRPWRADDRWAGGFVVDARERNRLAWAWGLVPIALVNGASWGYTYWFLAMDERLIEVRQARR